MTMMAITSTTSYNKGKAAWMKAGPNDAPDIVWAQVSFLFSSFILLESNEFLL